MGTFHEHYLEYEAMWRAPNRFYHGVGHLDELISKIDTVNLRLAYFCLFHDIIYDPQSFTNEEDSEKFFRDECHKFTDLGSEDVKMISKMILATKGHRVSSEDEINEAIRLDLAVLNSGLSTLLDYEMGIFKEYQFARVEQYRESRVAFLESYSQIENMRLLADIVKHRSYKIGIYAGSFDPFHVGHYNILKKSERLFDKVILVCAKNPEKGVSTARLPESLPNQKIYHDGLITDLFQNNDINEYTMVRGLRNTFDVAAEMNYQEWVNELDHSIRFVHLFADPDYAKISSSAIKSMRKFAGFDESRYLIN